MNDLSIFVICCRRGCRLAAELMKGPRSIEGADLPQGDISAY
ncbi:hypothetical protein CIT292_07040 [Citrobacter youngae ATCC 29220]|uniref:Uncharacterized protein n=1 Tax=Citrobacter youngae ATCC 29220 TaxID=500640 RepID=D4B9A0_9ENTR|nr:hypothetical protein CIT292_07040 [Citrobacter youngae ATCC 29220]